MKRVFVAATLAGAVLSSFGANSANAKVVLFSGNPATTFADGTFSHNLSGSAPDGFYPIGPTSAFNGFGQNHEFISFNHVVRLASLSIDKCGLCADTHPATFTVNLYDAGAGLVGTATVTASSTPQKLSFDKSDVKKVEFTFDGTDPAYGHRAWYQVSDVTYQSVVEPAVWTLMIGGFGLVGAALRRQRILSA